MLAIRVRGVRAKLLREFAIKSSTPPATPSQARNLVPGMFYAREAERLSLSLSRGVSKAAHTYIEPIKVDVILKDRSLYSRKIHRRQTVSSEARVHGHDFTFLQLVNIDPYPKYEDPGLFCISSLVRSCTRPYVIRRDPGVASLSRVSASLIAL